MAKSPDWDMLLENLLRVDYSLTNYTEALAAVLCTAKALSLPAMGTTKDILNTQYG